MRVLVQRFLRLDSLKKTDLPQNVESVHLIEQLHQGSLDFSVGARALRKPGQMKKKQFFQDK
jgi:hypothetical protein